jgi:hypothetical protein
MELSPPWRYTNEDEDALHFVVSDGPDQTEITLRRSEHETLYDFIAQRLR